MPKKTVDEWTLCPKSGLYVGGKVTTVKGHPDENKVTGEVAVLDRVDLGRFCNLAKVILVKVIFLPDVLMKKMKFKPGDFVKVTSESTSMTLKAIPLCGMQIGAVRDVVDLLKPKKKEVLSIDKINPSTISLARNVTLECDLSPEIDPDELTSFMIYSYEDHVLGPGDPFLVPFYGQNLVMQLKKDDAIQELIANIQNVNLNSETETKFDSYLMVASDTKVHLISKKSISNQSIPESNSSNPLNQVLGGLEKEIDLLKSYLKSVRVNTKTRSVKGILLWGPSGVGKSVLGRGLAKELNLNTIYLSASELFSKYYGESEENLRILFSEAKEKQPCLLFLDDLDSICSGSNNKSDQEQRVITALGSLLDDLKQSDLKIAVLAATNKISAVDNRLRRAGRFETEMEISVPNAKQRKSILHSILRSSDISASADVIEAVASSTHGFVGADLSSLVSEAEHICHEEGQRVSLSLSHFQKALKTVRPSAMREVLIEVPSVTWEDIGGLEELKESLSQAVEWPIKKPEVFTRFGITPPKGVLMYGPPGCSKTMIAKALANKSGLNFLAIKGPELFSKWVGESERAVRELFRKARQVAPAIVFFDEIDALGSQRGNKSGGQVGDRVLAQLLTEMDGIEQLKDVTIVAATNRPDMIDEALMRPGRLDRLFYVPLPDRETRRKIFNVHTRKKPLEDDVDFGALVDKTEGYSGAEIEAVCNEAALKALEEDFESKQIMKRHFDLAIEDVKPRLNSDLLQVYNKFRERQV